MDVWGKVKRFGLGFAAGYLTGFISHALISAAGKHRGAGDRVDDSIAGLRAGTDAVGAGLHDVRSGRDQVRSGTEYVEAATDRLERLIQRIQKDGIEGSEPG